MNRIFFILILLFSLSACTREKDVLPEREHKYFYVPAGFPSPFYDITNSITAEKFNLGKKLFFDPILSLDNTISCATCHQQNMAFADDVSFSVGINGNIGNRNSPTLINLAWNSNFMWDGGVNHIEVQPLAPLTNPNEMGNSLQPIIAKLNSNNEYKIAFQNIYQTDSITSAQLMKVLANFMSCLISSKSKYDSYLKGEMAFTTSELNGLQLFNQNCNSCHTAPLFTNNSYENNGIGFDPNHPDAGRYIITLVNSDSLKFKVPTLRNIEYSAPYMHDGRFSSLNDVLDHYASGNFAPGTHPNVQNIQLNAQEKNDLLNFLKTLTDYEFLNNSDFHP